MFSLDKMDIFLPKLAPDLRHISQEYFHIHYTSSNIHFN